MLLFAAPLPAHAETVYEFSRSCKALPLHLCFKAIAGLVDQAKQDGQGRAFCMPEVWVTPGDVTRSYPVSLLERLRVSLSAARFGRAEMPAEEALQETLAEIYPCE
ncbi:hypothetical protein V6C03_02215 [Methyloligella sp. 2.7D]|uniref:hypothetical protein n=1 Tax=unclassified Methyloligella TaxID=2625955 RepID=UPI001ABAC5ED|nr:hypothetical protein [Methyloligella sp. GL2]